MTSTTAETDLPAGRSHAPKRRAQNQAAQAGGGMSHRQIVVILTGLMLGMFLAALDQTIVASAIRTIGDDLKGLSVQAWVTTAYLITSTIATPLYGKLSDIFGRRPLFLIAISIFVVGSTACAFSTSMYMLAGFRAFQGLGAGGLFSLALAIIGDIVPPRERARYQGYFLAVFGTSSVLGPVIGGFFAGADKILWVSGWRWVFLVNVPIGIIALVVVTRTLHIPHQRQDHRIDYLGALMLVVGLVPMLTVLEQGRSWGWGSTRAIACYAVAAAGLLLFILVEHRAKDEALIPLRLFRNHSFSLLSMVGVITGLGMFGGLSVLPLYLQIVRGATPTESGLMLLPLTGGIMLGSIVSGQLISRTGRYKIYPLLGTALMIVGMYLLHTVGADTPFWRTEVFTAVFGLGLGNVMQPITLAVQNATSPRDIGVSTSSVTFFRQMGATIGTAIFLSILFSTVGDNIKSAFTSAARTVGFQQAVQDPAVRANPNNTPILSLLNAKGGGSVSSSSIDDTSFLKFADKRLAEPFFVGFSQSMDRVFLVGAIVLVAALLLLFFMREIPLRTQSAMAAVHQADAEDDAAAERAAAMAASSADGETREFAAVDGAMSDGAMPDGATSDGAASGNGVRPGVDASPPAQPAGMPQPPASPATAPVAVEPAAPVAPGQPASSGHPAHLAGATTSGSLFEPGPASTAEPAPAYGTAEPEAAGDQVLVLGRITDPHGGPVRSAVLTLADLGGRQVDRARSADDGGYRLRPPSGGTFLLICAADGYQPAASMVIVAGVSVRRDVVLAGAAQISGVVVRAQDGTPMAGVTVAVTDLRGQVVAATATGTDGRYVVSDVSAGEYTVTATRAGHRPVARSVSLAVGAVHRLDLELLAGGELTGVVRVASSGRPHPEATVTLVDDEGAVVGSVRTGADGGYRFGDLMPGGYTLITSGYAPVAQRVEVRGTGAEGVDVALGLPGIPEQDGHQFTGPEGRYGGLLDEVSE